jgi:hypothetical protein
MVGTRLNEYHSTNPLSIIIAPLGAELKKTIIP